MKRLVAFYALLLLLLIAESACAQVSYTSPQTIVQTDVLGAVTGPTTSGCLKNIGQTIHVLTYTVAGTPTSFQVRIEGSNDSDAATCTTGHWQAISDDATDTVNGGEVIGIGPYAFIRVNLVACGSCNAQRTIGPTINYSGSSSSPGISYGFYNPSQQIRKVLFNHVLSAGSANSISVGGISCPYGSANGVIVFHTKVGDTITASTTITVTLHWADTSFDETSFSIPTTGVTSVGLAIPEPATPCTSVDVTEINGTGANITLTALYYFYPVPSVHASAQPPNTSNTEATSSANASVSTSISPTSKTQRAYLYSINARCSAGTSQVTVTDGTTQIWSSAATEIGTTSFSHSWTPGLAAAPLNSLTVTLATCGVGNTGTLDVQGSFF